MFTLLLMGFLGSSTLLCTLWVIECVEESKKFAKEMEEKIIDDEPMYNGPDSVEGQLVTFVTSCEDFWEMPRFVHPLNVYETSLQQWIETQVN